MKYIYSLFYVPMYTQINDGNISRYFTIGFTPRAERQSFAALADCVMHLGQRPIKE